MLIPSCQEQPMAMHALAMKPTKQKPTKCQCSNLYKKYDIISTIAVTRKSHECDMLNIKKYNIPSKYLIK